MYEFIQSTSLLCTYVHSGNTHTRTRTCTRTHQAWGKHLGQMLEVLPQALGKVLKHKHKHKCFNKANASST